VLAALALTLALGGCGDGDASEEPQGSATSTATGPDPRRDARPVLCGRLVASVTGRVETSAASELSGLVVSRSQPGVLWAHNDSGDEPRVLALAPDGRLRAELRVPGAQNVDWEDIALSRSAGSGGRDVLYLADIGDNDEQRSEVVVYHTPEPRVGAPGAAMRGATERAQRLALRYPDGPHDAETLLVDGATRTLAIVTKSLAGVAVVYVTRGPAPGATVTLRRAAKLALQPGAAITAGDVSADGRTVVLRGYDRAYVFARRGGEALSRTLRRQPCVAGSELSGEGQGEALALAADGRSFYTVPEGERPPMRRYAPAR
jgi:hypothetical protein